MRELKFRAWNKSRRRFLDASAILADICGGQLVWADDKNHRIIEFFDDEIIIMQYTGLKDKNGVEIYEGDIVAYDDGCWNDCTEEKCAPHNINVFAVEWQDYRGDIEVGMVGFWLGWEGDEEFNPRSIEVIGNIYENPELLKR